MYFYQVELFSEELQQKKFERNECDAVKLVSDKFSSNVMYLPSPEINKLSHRRKLEWQLTQNSVSNIFPSSLIEDYSLFCVEGVVTTK